MSLLEHTISTPRHLRDRWCHRYSNLDDRTDQQDVTGKIVVITGANGGVGKVVALQMAKRGARVVMACRNLQKTEEAVREIKEQVPTADLTVVSLDLSDLDSVRSCAEEIKAKFPHVNILINNGGIMLSSRVQRTATGHERHLVTNYLGHVLLTMLLLDQLKLGAPARVVLLSSTLAEGARVDPEDLNWEKPNRSLQFLNLGPYNDSKKLLILFGKELGQRLQQFRITLYSVCPGVSRTDLTNDFPFAARMFIKAIHIPISCSAEQGATNVMYCALSEKCAGETGHMYHYEKPWERVNQHGKNEGDLSTKVWIATQKLLGMSFDGIINQS